MGWLFHATDTGQTKKEYVQEILTKSVAPYSVVAHRTVGNHLWTVLSHPEHGTMIVLFLLAKQRGGGWGYKDMTESMGPCYYTCPLSFLDMVPCPGGYATEWREKVRKHHARTSLVVKLGDVVQLVEGCKPSRVRITLVGKGSRGKLIGEADGRAYTIRRNLIACVVVNDAP